MKSKPRHNTEAHHVRLSVATAGSGWSDNHPILSKAASVIAFEVADTGIGIPADKQRIIFEAFRQADAGTSRKYGGTGLGLAISRDIIQKYEGTIRFRSVRLRDGQATCFAVFIRAAVATQKTEGAAAWVA